MKRQILFYKEIIKKLCAGPPNKARLKKENNLSSFLLP